MYQLYWPSYLQFEPETSLNIFKLKGKCYGLFLHLITSTIPVIIHSNMYFSKDNAQAFDISLNVDLELHLQVKLLVQFISYRGLQQKSNETTGPYRSKYITHHNTVNKWIASSHHGSN